MRRIAAAFAVGLLAACSGGGSGSGGASLKSAADVAGLLGCAATFKVDEAPAAELLPTKPISRGSCQVDGEAVSIKVYTDRGARENVEGEAKKLGCAVAKGFGVKNVAYVSGENWTATPSSETVARRIAVVAHADAVVFQC